MLMIYVEESVLANDFGPFNSSMSQLLGKLIGELGFELRISLQDHEDVRADAVKLLIEPHLRLGFFQLMADGILSKLLDDCFDLLN